PRSRVPANAQDLGDLFHPQAFPVAQHERHSLLLGEAPFHRSSHLVAQLAAGEGVLRTVALLRQSFEYFLPLPARPAPAVFGDAVMTRDRVQPRSEPLGMLESANTLPGRDENLLCDFQRTLGIRDPARAPCIDAVLPPTQQPLERDLSRHRVR